MTIPAKLSFPLGRVLGQPKIFTPSEDDLTEHMAIFGGTRKGKSKLLELLLRQLIEGGRGFCLIDPHGDLAEDLAAYIADRIHKVDDLTAYELTHRLHYLEPNRDTLFSYDPFAYTPPAGAKKPFDDDVYRDWLKAKVETVTKIIIRQQGEFDTKEKARLGRWLRCVLYAVGVATDDKGTHLSLGDAFSLLDPGDREQHEEIYQRVAHRLPHRYHRFFEKLRQTKRPLDQEQWVESTLGRLEAFLYSSLVEELLSQKAPSIDFRRIIDTNGILLVNLKRTPHCSIEQGNAIGGMIIHEILEAVQTVDRDDRHQYSLFIDEASRFIGRDLNETLAQCGKWKLSVCLAVQGLAQLRNEQTDMVPDVLGLCGMQFTFQQRYIPDAQILAASFFTPNLDFTKHVEERDRHRGYEYVRIEGGSKTITKGKSRTVGGSVAVNESKTHEESSGYTSDQNWSDTASRDRGNSYRDDHPDSRVYRVGDGTARSQGGSESANRGTSESKSKGITETEDWNSGESESEADAESWQEVPLAMIEVEHHVTPQLENSVDDQLNAGTQQMRRLEKREVLVSVSGHPCFAMRVAEVIDPFAGHPKEWRAAHLTHLKSILYGVHPYFYRPQLGQDHSPASYQMPAPTAADDEPTTPALNI